MFAVNRKLFFSLWICFITYEVRKKLWKQDIDIYVIGKYKKFTQNLLQIWQIKSTTCPSLYSFTSVATQNKIKVQEPVAWISFGTQCLLLCCWSLWMGKDRKSLEREAKNGKQFFWWSISGQWKIETLKAWKRLVFALRKEARAQQGRKMVKHKAKAPGLAWENYIPPVSHRTRGQRLGIVWKLKNLRKGGGRWLYPVWLYQIFYLYNEVNQYS